MATMVYSMIKPMRWLGLVFGVALGIGLALPAAAQWKWRDKSGQIQYSDLPPPNGTPAQDILQKPGATARREAVVVAASPGASGASSPSLAAPKTSDPELEAKRRKAEEDKVAKARQEDEKTAAGRAENCTRARSYLKTLDDGMRVARTNAKGEREVLDDKGRAEETARTRGVIATDCK